MATVAIMWNKQFLLEKWHLKTCWMQGCHKLSFVKKKKKARAKPENNSIYKAQ